VSFSVEHIGVAARDPAALADWYCNVLDGKILLRIEGTPPAFFVRLSGGLVIEFYAAEKSIADTSQNRLGGWRHLALRVESIESSRREMEKKGVCFEQEVKPAGGGGRVLFFRDPEENLLHLVERPEGWEFPK